MLRSFVCIALLLGTSHAGVLTWENSVERRAVGFSLVPDWKLEGSNLDPTCKKVLQQSINCDSYVDELRHKEYHGSLEDSSLTNTVCSVQCERALLTAQRRISAACSKTPEVFPGVPVNSLIDPIVSGWNETCLRGDSTGEYCNDVIESWGDFEALEAMKKEQLCSYCFGEKLRQMQRSPYSAYDGLFAKQLEYINAKCNSEIPTEPLENPIKVNYTLPETCSDSNVYIGQEGDTCDSIALAKSVSAATLYYNNPNLRNCSDIEAGLELCIPESCKTYQVKEDDDCIQIGIDSARCGEYIQAQVGSSCRKMLASSEKAATMDLLLKANPSLKTSSECDNNLVPNTWYCLRPLPYFGSRA
ncbi:unnamed protein product [Fusarium equiseti]|uniref:LysM domain-containing protein n=1 Tax=Fusarium equiseti TaxID=61235 RepID=A0A8J2NKE0_FUSEQ|nr:unnamed protein product [Fusarium equiseti]